MDDLISINESNLRQDDIYVFVKYLGQGSFGRVNLYRNTADNSLVVWKEIALKGLDVKMKSEAFAEVEILSMLNHPNIISYYKHFIGDETLYIELEYAKAGTLADHIKRQKIEGEYFDQETILWHFYQLCKAVEYIHDVGIMHRDIKALNIFFMQSGLLKLGDFGISKNVDPQSGLLESVISNYFDSHNKRIKNIRIDFKMVGTPLYMSPELIEGKKYSNKSDIWAVGCVAYEMMTLNQVFNATVICTFFFYKNHQI